MTRNIRGLIDKEALEAGEDPKRLSVVHAVRVIRRKLPVYAALPPGVKKMFHKAVLAEILLERVVSSRGCRNTRGVKRKMSNFPLRQRVPCHVRVENSKCITIIK